MSVEQRGAQRFAVELVAEVEVGGEVWVAATQNISSGGVGLVLDRPLTEGQKVALQLFLTQDGIEDPDEEPLEISATVRWTSEGDRGRHLAGVRFEAVDDGQQTQLGRFLAALSD